MICTLLCFCSEKLIMKSTAATFFITIIRIIIIMRLQLFSRIQVLCVYESNSLLGHNMDTYASITRWIKICVIHAARSLARIFNFSFTCNCNVRLFLLAFFQPLVSINIVCSHGTHTHTLVVRHLTNGALPKIVIVVQICRV